MKIGIDVRQLVLGASGGVSQLVKGVCERMIALYPQHEFLIFCTAFNRSLLSEGSPNTQFFTFPTATFFSDLDRVATNEDLAVLFRAYPMEDSLEFPLSRQIFLIPDIQHEAYPEFFSEEVLRTRRAAFAIALARAGAIGTISEFAKTTLQEFPATRCSDIFLMEPALQAAHRIQASDLSEAERQLIPSSDFLLFPANLWPHKNHRKLLEAFRLLQRKATKEVRLVLTGHPSGWPELYKDFRDLPVVHLGYVRPELLRALLENASALVFFSLYEGFGIPLLEAFDASTPVVCSNTTSLPEVGGDAVLSCDPTDIGAMASSMERILADDKLRSELVAKGRTRLNNYSWEKSARSLLEACKRVDERAATTRSAALDHKPSPLVSIVTPSFNQGCFLRRTIESVLGQTYPNIQYVVIDGGSTDESVDILESYGDRFDWISEPDKGQTDAINKGMARVQGDILAYLNSDDVLLPDAVEKVVRFFQAHPQCDMVYGDADYIDVHDNIIGRYKTAGYSFSRLVQDCMVCQPATFWRRRAAERVGPFDEALNYTMDYDYWLRIAEAGKGDIRFLPERLAQSRLYAETKTLSARPEIFREIFKICQKHTGFVSKNYFQGYWHHLLYEKSVLLRGVLRFSPGAHVPLGWLHHKLRNRRRYTRKQIVHYARRKWGAAMKRVRYAGGRGMGPTRGVVTGLWDDNWLGPVVFIAATPKKAVGQLVHIGGVPAADGDMTILVGKKVIKRVRLTANRAETVVLPAEALAGSPLIVRFSCFTTSPDGRKKAFLLEDTNIISEQDAW